MRALCYYALRNQRVWKKLQSKVRSHFELFQLVSHAKAHAGVPRWRSMRDASLPPGPIHDHGALSLPLPDGSLVLAGPFLGMSPYIAGRNKGIFGEDPNEFKPERWLQMREEMDEQYKKRITLWKTTRLTFDSGSCICRAGTSASWSFGRWCRPWLPRLILSWPVRTRSGGHSPGNVIGAAA